MKVQEIPTLFDFNSDTKAFTEAMLERVDYFNDFLHEFQKEWPKERSDVDDGMFIQFYCERFEDYLFSFKACTESISREIEKAGAKRGPATREALASPLGLMQKKYLRVYNKMPKKYRLRAGSPGLKALLRDAEAMEHLHKDV